MKRWGLAGLAGGAVMALGLAGVAVSVPAAALAQARAGLAVINQDGAASWGAGGFGQLGNGTWASSAVFGPVSGFNADVVRVSAGGGHGLALRTDGTVWTWGDSSYGELGNGPTSLYGVVPAQVKGLSGVTRIAAGEYSSTAFAASATRVWAWGDNSEGQLGDGTFTQRAVPGLVTGIGAPGIAGVTVGAGFVLVQGTDGSIWGWGEDEYGQLGNLPGQPVTRPLQTSHPRTGITQLSAGDCHVLALQSDGTVLAWGGNADGELGRGTVTTSGGPGLVTGLTNVSQVSAGFDYSLAVYQSAPVAA
jgi:alpha-tubulin suppressor-like RCC1 family protein